jgi:hypothetical protein
LVNHVIKIMVGDEVKTDMEFSQSRGLLSGRFLVFNFE